MNIRKFAAIDIGSNAIRLLITNVVEVENTPTHYQKSSLVRVPIRLGADSFTTGIITDENIRRMADAMEAFKLIMGIYGVEKYKACATSAMREASNGDDVARIIFEKTGVLIEIIEGKVEAAIIASTNLNELIQIDRSYLYVDVGGGSTEFSFFNKGKVVSSKSFKLGTVREISDSARQLVLKELEEWIKLKSKDMGEIELIGSGGNINKIFKMSGKPLGQPLSLIYLKKQFNYLMGLSYDERIYQLGLNPDRADVIIPAIKIYIDAMAWCKAKRIYVPKIGLSDGIIKSLHQGILQ